MIITGKIVKGFGEGSFYVGKYGQLFEQALGFLPFAGTLNVKVERKPELKNPITVSPGGSFKPVHCYLAKIGDMRCAIVMPEATRHPKDVIEIIAPVSVKQHYSLKDGDKIECSIE